jgi:serine/threonine protein kinase
MDDAESQIFHESSFYLLIPPHPHLLKLEAISCKGLFFELASSDFYHRLKDRTYRYETLSKHFFEIASALGHIHMQGYNYKDLKPSNILVFPDEKVKLCDLGFLEPSKHDKDRIVCAHFAAPEYESSLDTIITPKADVWAFGVCLFQALTRGKYPLLNCYAHRPDYFQKVVDFSKKNNITTEYLFQTLNTSNKKILTSRDPHGYLLPIIAACLRHNPQDRPSIQELEQFFHAKTLQLHPSS